MGLGYYSFRLCVFPTGVGVNRDNQSNSFAAMRIPHRRGGEPTDAAYRAEMSTYSPQAWG